MSDLVAVTEWGTVAADPDHPTAQFARKGPNFRDVRFRTEEVLTVWQVEQASTAPAPSPPESQVAQRRLAGGAPRRHDWDAFWIEVCVWAAANDLDERYRPQLQKLMEDWTAENSDSPPAPTTIRKKLATLYKRGGMTSE